jgi:cation-transporting ATPase 13A1
MELHSCVSCHLTCGNDRDEEAHALALYPLLAYAYYLKYDEWIKSEEWTFVFCVLLFGGHALSFLITAWSTRANSKIAYTTVS